MSSENTSTWGKIKDNVCDAFSAAGNWFAETAVSVRDWIVEKYKDIFDKDDKESEKNGESEKETITVYDVVGAGNSPISSGYKTWEEADAWRKANSPISSIVERQVEVEKDSESQKENKEDENSLSGKWTVWEAGAPIGGTHDTKESAEQWRKDHNNIGTVRSWDEITNQRSQAASIVDTNNNSTEAENEMD